MNIILYGLISDVLVGEDGSTEMHNIFVWSANSKTDLLLFVDICIAILRRY